MFDAFKRELKAHPDPRYHRLEGTLKRSEVTAWFKQHSITPPKAYLNFLCQVGPGCFFAGGLTVYPLAAEDSKSVESELANLRAAMAEAEPVFSFGYGGTTDFCYCLDAHSGADTVYQFWWEDGLKESLETGFEAWMEAQPAQYDEQKYNAAYAQPASGDALAAVMEERAAFHVRLVSFDKELRRPPDKPNDFLPRYHKLVLEITKTRPVKIPVLTVVIARLGSMYGAANVWHETLPVAELPVNIPTILEWFAFDPYNRPFEEIAVQFDPVIVLGSPSRTAFRELEGLLPK